MAENSHEYQTTLLRSIKPESLTFLQTTVAELELTPSGADEVATTPPVVR
jgi:hypothetical protein